MARAFEVLNLLERSDKSNAHKSAVDDLPLFAASRPQSSPPSPAGDSAVEKMLAAIVPDALSPRDALELLYKLKAAMPDKT